MLGGGLTASLVPGRELAIGQKGQTDLVAVLLEHGGFPEPFTSGREAFARRWALAYRERLIREAQSAGILSHPGIVTIYDIAQEGEMAYIFMEFVNGPPLEKVLLSESPPALWSVIAP